MYELSTFFVFHFQIQGMANKLYPQNVRERGGKDATSSTDSGIQLGSESLSSCDTPVGDSTTDTGDSDIENDVEASTNARQVCRDSTFFLFIL